MVRLIASCIFLILSGSWTIATQRWTLADAIISSGIPAALYVVQNYCTLVAYQNLPPVTFNVLNQTKTLSAALCCFLIMGKRQSRVQVASLLLLLFSALVIEKVVPVLPWRRRSNSMPSSGNGNEGDTFDWKTHFTMGVIPVLLASLISGLGTKYQCKPHGMAWMKWLLTYFFLLVGSNDRF